MPIDWSRGSGVYGTWEVGVDHCDFCDRVATEAVAATEPRVRIRPLCPQHAELAEATTGVRMERGGATCMATIRQESGEVVPCGAVATHVELTGVYDDDGEPQLIFVAVCRRHAKSSAR